jgi:DNA-binding winged helix-turn-helix (wHTH) protein
MVWKWTNFRQEALRQWTGRMRSLRLYPKTYSSTMTKARSGMVGPSYLVQCFGSFEVTDAAGKPVVWALQKARELLAYLVAQEGRSVPREEVEEALWPEAPPAQVERLLANAAYQLRKAFRQSGGPETQVLSVSGQRYHLQRNLFRVDTEAFVAHLRRAEGLNGSDALAEYERALALYRGDFLAGRPTIGQPPTGATISPGLWPRPLPQAPSIPHQQSGPKSAAHRANDVHPSAVLGPPIRPALDRLRLQRRQHGWPCAHQPRA